NARSATVPKTRSVARIAPPKTCLNRLMPSIIPLRTAVMSADCQQRSPDVFFETKRLSILPDRHWWRRRSAKNFLYQTAWKTWQDKLSLCVCRERAVTAIRLPAKVLEERIGTNGTELGRGVSALAMSPTTRACR